MGKVYQSVRGVVQGTLNRRKPEIVVSARANGDDTDLDDAMEELEKLFSDGIRKLKAAASEDQAVIANEAQQVEQVIEGLRATITGLEAKLRETEEALHSKDLASQKLAETLNTEIRDLRSALQKKDEVLEGRDSEVNDLKSNRDGLAEQVTQLELAIQQTKGEAASLAQHAAKVIEGLKIKIATLEAQRRQPEQMVGGIDWTIKGLDQDGDRQVTDINPELDLQTGTMKKAAGVTSVIEKPARKTVSQEAFDRLIAEFSKLTNVIESIASLIVRD